MKALRTKAVQTADPPAAALPAAARQLQQQSTELKEARQRREIHMIEEKCSEKLRSRPQLSDESDLRLGMTLSKGNVCMAPALREFVAGEMRDVASIFKERRKAREERHLQRAPPGDSGGGGGGKQQ